MAEPTQSLDAAQFAAFKAGDEQALVAVFRSQFDGLVAHARESLGSDIGHFGGRVAQLAMLGIWGRRAAFDNADGLSAALREAVVAEAAKQRRRHAALNRQGASSHSAKAPSLTVDEAVAKLMADLHPAPVDHDAAATEVKEAQKRHAAQQMKNVARKRSWKGTAAIIVVLGSALAAGMYWLNLGAEERAISEEIAKSDTHVLSAQRGQQGSTELNDKSGVKIGSESKLRVPDAFGKTMRTLELTGTASFTVAPGNPLPFSVRAGNAIITATGTKFAARSYVLDSAVLVSVEEGSVSVRAKDAKEITTLPAGKALRMAPDGTVQMLDDAARSVAFAWVRDTLAFSDEPLGYVMSELIRWFDLKALLEDSTIGQRKLSLQVGMKTSGDDLFKALTKAANLTIGFDKKKNILLKDAGTAPAK